jgi:hypothetical protein
MTRMCVCMALASIALLGACTGRDRIPPATVVQTVDRPVAVPCLKPGSRPAQPKKLTEDLPVAPNTLTEMVGRLRAKLTEWADYGQTADSLLRVCETIPAAKGDGG